MNHQVLGVRNTHKSENRNGQKIASQPAIIIKQAGSGPARQGKEGKENKERKK